MGITVFEEFNVQISFDNGWSLAITKLECGHLEYCIVPRVIIENKEHGVKEFNRNPDYWNEKAMSARGDLVRHFDGTDDELIAIIVAVRLRQPEPSLKKTAQDIMKAVKP